MIYVIGSGPAGISAAIALLEKGREVTMLDAGIELEPERQSIVDAMQRTDFEHWNPEDIARLKEGMTPNSKGIPLKMIYGSDYPYREAETFFPLEQRAGIATGISLAQGGFSNVWGAVLLPYRADDIRTWPIGLQDLAEHYSAVLSFMGMSGRRDDLDEILPLYQENPRLLDSSPQAVAFLADMAKHRETLQSRGIRFGLSRLACRTEPENGKPGCVYCGLCMYGCPNEIIYSSSYTLRKLQQDERFTYIPNIVVERLREDGEGVSISGQNRLTGEPVQFQAERVLLGCGTIATTRILLESLEAYDHPLELLDSQYFLVPFLRYRKTGRPRSDRLHTLAQAFLEINDPAISSNSIHLQTYTYNDLYLGAMKNLFGPAFPLLKPVIHAVVDRMFVMQGYLHSDLSPTAKVTLKRPSDSRPGQLVLEQVAPSIPSKKTIRQVLKKIGSCGKYLLGRPLGVMLQVAPTGRGFHSGGTFPMRREPKEFECDTLGRPYGMKFVHVVDSTAFPSIPATTITLSVMANAHRIAGGVADV
jgi:choline dehydrogenase-like flavoprotein